MEIFYLHCIDLCIQFKHFANVNIKANKRKRRVSEEHLARFD